MQKNKGFTLLEMMTVIAIVAIVSAIAIPNLISYATTYRLRSAARDVYSNLQEARTKAVQQNTRWAVNFSAAGYQVINCGPDNDCSSATASDDITVKTIVVGQDYPGITMVQTFSGNQVAFTSEGTCDASAAGNITFTNAKGKTATVTVSASGAITSS